MHKSAPLIVWFRQDLRLGDNPALSTALNDAKEAGAPILPVYILDDKAAGKWAVGGAQRWALHHALDDLNQHLPLVLRRGDSLTILRKLIAETGATAIYWNRRYEKSAIDQDIEIKQELGIDAHSFNGRLLAEPWEIKNGQKQPYRVFTPYWRAVLQFITGKSLTPFPTPRNVPAMASPPHSDTLASWGLLPTKPDWAGGIRAVWTFTEKAAHKALTDFIDDPLPHYSKGRDFPSIDATSRLSPYLALGLISPRQIWHEVTSAMQDGRITPGAHGEAEKFLRQIIWREFSYHLLFHFPHTDTKPLNPQFETFPWRHSQKDLTAWQRGQTGYPLVDAGMRQLWQTGWMHNRVRMIVASFLVKHLLLRWQDGAAWFWDTLLDADLANNTMGWQWVAGSGADAAPYFRVFNPMLQSEKFNAAEYIRHYVPELANLPDKYIHAPWEAPATILQQSKVLLGKDYPLPIVDHVVGRTRALEALKETK